MITPMVARLEPVPFDREGWLFELKWDGFRCIAEKDRQGVRLYSRNHNDFSFLSLLSKSVRSIT
jgi:bifunctional non-homologous end joining protein LigD